MKQFYVFLIALFAIPCLQLQAQCDATLATSYVSNNSNKGEMFNIVTGATAITINSFDVNLILGASGTYEIFYKSGSYVGSENDPTAWTSLGTAIATTAGFDAPSPIPIPINVAIPANSTYSFYITATNVAATTGIRYTNNGGYTNIASDAYITIAGGIGKAYPFLTNYNNRSFNGTVHYNTGIGTPTITSSGVMATVCNSATAQTTSMPYTATTNSPISYSIDWDAAANTAGLTDQATTAFAFAAGSGNLNTVTVPANVPNGTYTGTLGIRNAGSCNNTAAQVVTLIVNSGSVGGTVTGGTTICPGSTSALLTLSGHTGSVVRWQSSVSPFSVWTNIPNTNTTYTSGTLTATTQFRAEVQSGSCTAVFSTPTTVTINDVTAPVANLATLPVVNASCSVASITAPTATDNCLGTVTGTTTTTFPITASTTVVWRYTDGVNTSTQNQSVVIADTTAPVANLATLPAVNASCSVASITAPTATDNCLGTVTGTTTTTFPITASTTVVWRYTDGANTSTQNQSVVINDTTAPVASLATLPAVNASCSVASITAPTATDNCLGTVTGTTTTTFPITASTTVVWRYTDGANTSTQNQSVVIADTTAPVANLAILPAVNAQCSVASITAPTATDNCLGTVTGTTTTTFPITASTTVVWRYTDGANTSTQNQSVVINDTTAPVASLATLPAVNAQCSVASITAPTATDNCLGTVTGTTTTVFPITASTTVVWTYTDGVNTSTQNQSVVISDTTAPVASLATLPAVNAQCSVASITAPTATDNCLGAVIGTTTTVFPITASTTVVWSYTDGVNSSTQNQSVLISDTAAPVADIASLPTINGVCNVAAITAPTATDNCAGTVTGTTTAVFPITATTTVVWTYTDGTNTSTQNQSVVIADTTAPVADLATLPAVNSQCSVTSLTAPMATDNCAGAVTGTTTTVFPITATTTVVWTYTDGANTSTQNQNVIINDTTAPVANLATLPAVNSQCSVASITAPTATDNCAGAVTGTTTTIFPITATTTIVWTYTDGANTSTQNQNVVIADTTAPVADLAALPAVNSQCSVASIIAPMATDNCAGAVTGTTTTVFPITATTTIVWTYTDGANTSTQNQSIVIADTTAPVADIGTLPVINVQCSVASLTAPTATDNCAGIVTGTTTAIFPITATTTVVWTYTDGANISTQNQSVVIADATAPVADIAALPVINAQCSVASLTAPTATDNCVGTVTGTTTAVFPITATTTVVWTYTDGANTSTQNQSVVIADTTAPVADLVTLPAVNSQCSVASIPAPTATDNCIGTVTGTTTTAFPITATTTVIWTYTDGANTSTQNQSVVISDTTAPVADLATLPVINAQCSVAAITAPTATDNCVGTVTGTTTTVFPITATTTVVWTYTDGTNTSTQNQSVVISDTTAPVADLATLPVINAQCSVVAITAPTATDNCIGTVTGTTTTVFPITATTTVIWTYTDGANTSTQNQSVVISDTTAPVADLATLPVINAQCSVVAITAPTATDNCVGTVTGTTAAVFPITATTTVIWTYTDGTNTSTQNQNVVIADTTAPVADVASLPVINGQCSVAAITAPTATDNCVGTVTGTTTTVFPITATTTVVWTYTDGVNTSTQNQNVVINDTMAPVADLASLPIINAQCSVAMITAPTATDNCVGTVTGTTTTVFPLTASATVVWTYTDGINTSTQNQNVVIADTTAPVADLATLPVINAQCNVGAITAPTATDNCEGAIVGTTTTVFPLTASATVVWTYTDGINTSTQNQSVVIADTMAPVADLATLPVINAQCNVAAITAPTATDNCEGTIVGTTTTVFPLTASATVVWTYTDGINTSTQNQSVVIADTMAPVADLTTLPTVTADCSVAGITAPTATDNCEGAIIGTTTTVFPITASTTVIWTYTDGINSSTQNQSVVIIPVRLRITDPQPVCESGTVDITQAAVTAGSTGNGTLSYWQNPGATVPLANPAAVPATGTYYIKSVNGSCSDIKPVRVLIKELPTASISGETVCYNSSGDVTFNGTPNTIVTYTIDGGPNRTVALGTSGSATVRTPALRANSTYQLVSVGYSAAPFCTELVTGNATVTIVMPVADFTPSVSGALTGNTTITVTLSNDNGFVLYQIDDEIPQATNLFTNVSPGIHIITVTDSYGCTYISKPVTVIGYPKFFTPNGDGHNDYWNIIGIHNSDSMVSKVVIFDRYGKLVRQLNTRTDSGWDGTYNGSPLPADDYWFTMEYEENDQIKVFKSHFSLLR